VKASSTVHAAILGAEAFAALQESSVSVAISAGRNGNARAGSRPPERMARAVPGTRHARFLAMLLRRRI